MDKQTITVEDYNGTELCTQMSQSVIQTPISIDTSFPMEEDFLTEEEKKYESDDNWPVGGALTV